MLVLVVDDDDDLREALRVALGDAGHDCLLASNGSEALVLLRNGAKPAVILLDLMMPIVNGWQFRAEQLSDPSIAAIPVIVATAAGLGAGDTIEADAVIRKPFPVETLLDLISRIGR